MNWGNDVELSRMGDRPASVQQHRAELRQNKYLNNIVEQDHRFIKKLVKPTMGFQSFHTVRRTLQGYEAMNVIRKGQIKGIEKGNILERVYK